MANVHRIDRAGWPQPPLLEVGEVVLGTVINGIENPRAKGKPRPVVLVSNRGSLWRGAGLTTLNAYRDGNPRVAVPNPREVGLNGPGFLWGENLVGLCVLDIERHLGWVDLELAQLIARLAHLDGTCAQSLLDAASFHHPHPPKKEGSR